MKFGLFGNENRSAPTSLEDPRVSLNDPIAFAEAFGSGGSVTGENVNSDSAMSVAAIWQAVNMIAATIAHLPLHLYTIDKSGNVEKKTKDPLYRIVHDRANDVHTSFAFWKWVVTGLSLDGRSIALIAHDKLKRVRGFIPVNQKDVKVTQTLKSGVLSRSYTYQGITYEAAQILDFALTLKLDGVSHYNPVDQNRNSIALMMAAERFSAVLFANGGVPPLTLTGPLMSAAAATRANADLEEQLRGNKSRQRKILPIPTGFDLKPIGIDPSKQQLIELRQWMISEVSRIFNISPAMLHDLTNGTYSNFEHQSLNFAKNTIAPLVELIEQELNSKLFGDRNKSDYVEFNMDGLQRGDFLSRMEGSAKAVFAGIRTPNEIRALDNLAALEGGDKLYMQGANMPLDQLGKMQAVAPQEPVEPPVSDPDAEA
jgi:HK97 family phage portal protein